MERIAHAHAADSSYEKDEKRMMSLGRSRGRSISREVDGYSGGHHRRDRSLGDPRHRPEYGGTLRRERGPSTNHPPGVGY